MISLLYTGDSDVLRDAVSPSTIFWHRAKRAPWQLAGFGALTLALALVIYLAVIGPDQSGILWATRERLAAIVSALTVGWVGYGGWTLFKLLPSRNDRVVIALRDVVRNQIDPLEEKVKALTDDELRAKRREFEQRLKDGEAVDAIRPEAYACVREASRRARAHRHFECQLIGANVIERCNVAEMRTGEGKTIVCYAANFMKVIQGQKVHMVTVNDYLVKRDAEFCRPIFDLLGVTVGFISHEMEPWGPGVRLRQAAYNCDITYGTNSEFGFDYLRDNMKHDLSEQMQGKHDFAVVDEVDSILIDEARTPLIISGAAQDDITNYVRADAIARALIRRQEQAVREFTTRVDEVEANPPPQAKGDPRFKGALKRFRADPLWLTSEEAELIGFLQYYVVELDRKSAHMTEHGAKAAQAELGIGTFYDGKNMNWPHYIDNALKAHVCYTKDKDYVIQDGIIVIVDEFTGRLMQGRQWSDGMHQAVEAKEKVQVKQETQTLASITLQNLFKLYKHLAGMTGTAMTEADEFMKIYRLEVIAIPTNKAIRRVDYNDKVYKSETAKFKWIVEEVNSYSTYGYPADPWSLYDMLRDAKRKLRVLKSEDKAGDVNVDEILAAIDKALSAFNDGRGETEPLKDAYLKLVGENVGGRPVLVGTTSVEASERLSQALTRQHGIEHEVLNAKFHAREAEIVAKAGQRHESKRGGEKRLVGNVTIATNMAGRGTDIVLGPGVAALGGLHVVGTERHEARRIDNQLRGRCGRQGDPGSSRFFLSLEDQLLKLFMADWLLKILGRTIEDDVPIEAASLTNGIAKAQRKVEERNFGIRKHLLEYDEVPDQQRKQFYTMRQRILEGRDLSNFIWEMLDETLADAVDRYYDPGYPAICAAEWAVTHLNTPIDYSRLDTKEYAVLSDQVRELADSEVRGSVQRTFGEYIDTDSDPADWDLRGFKTWASAYGINLTERQIREADPDHLRDQIMRAAADKIAQSDLTPLQEFVDKNFGKSRLAAWALDKFGITVPLDELSRAGRDEAQKLFEEKMRAAYRRREIEYPVAAIVDFALQRAGNNVNSFYEQVAKWANLKFRLGVTFESFKGREPGQVFNELRTLNESYLQNGKLDAEIDAAMQAHEGDALRTWAEDRFGAVMKRYPLDGTADMREQLRRCGYEMLRYELTHLERMVLLNTLDGVWKDHMYAMDLLRGGIGLRGYAERDPKTEFKREGTRLFQELMSNIRERVSDLIFKVQVPLPAGAETGPATAAPPRIIERKADATGAGFATAQTEAEQKAGQAGSEQAVQPIRRDTPRVGRNDPCPCGSGKKYKACHGKLA